ncbi:SDR family oxidoreductase [Opitutaceae bacterium]|nr:SDR family oxidoreductase [Opitutaceae bacterium]
MPPDPSNLANRVAVITGGAGEIGTAFAKGLLSSGINVAILDVDGEKAETLAARLGADSDSTVLGLACDVLDETSIKRADTQIVERLGAPSFLINCAGGNHPDATTAAEQLAPDLSNLDESFFGIDVGGFRQVMDLNLLGTVLPCSVIGKRLVANGGGAIINISSMNAYRPLTRIPAYSAGKSAVTNFTEWLAVHLAPTQVRVNAIAPGFFLTEQLKYLAFEENGDLTPRYQKVLANTPMNRFGDPEELVSTLLYLISDQSKFVTGVVIPVDGGFNAFSGV